MANFENLPLSLYLENLSSQVSGSTFVGVDLQIASEESDNGVPSYMKQLLEFTGSMDAEVLNVINHVQKKATDTTGKWRTQHHKTPTSLYKRTSTRSNVPQATKIYNDSAKASLVALLKNAKCEGQSVRTVIKPLILSYLGLYVLSEVAKQKIVADMVKMLGCPDKE